VSAGTFAATANGSAVVRATYALAPDKLAAIAVTEEPEGGSKQPTTTPFLVGAAGGK
jgi:anti-sigma-K factor RskA